MENMVNATMSTRNNPDKYMPAEYTQDLDNLQQEQCEKKVGDLSILDSYSAPEAVFTLLTDLCVTDRPSVYPDIQACEPQFPSKYTEASKRVVQCLGEYKYYIEAEFFWAVPLARFSSMNAKQKKTASKIRTTKTEDATSQLRCVLIWIS